MSDSIDNQLEYQEQVLEDLDEIKGSLSDEENQTDEEYQKKVLGSLRSLEKSVQTLIDDDLSTLDYYYSQYSSDMLYPTFASTSTYPNSFVLYTGSIGNRKYYVYRTSGIDKLFVTFNMVDSPTTCRIFLTDVKPSIFFNLKYGDSVNINNGVVFSSGNGSVSTTLLNNTNSPYLYCYTANDESSYDVTYYSSVSSSSGGGGTIVECNDYTEPLDTLIQISTFQGFASALLTGILLFLIFVKGLRR